MSDIVASYYAISGKINDPNLRKWWKTSFWVWFRPVRPKFGVANFFYKNPASSVTRYHGQLSSCTISVKTNDQSWENLVTDGRTHRRTDRQTDENDFIGHCPTKVERPINQKKFSGLYFFYFTLKYDEKLFLRSYHNST